MDAVPVVLAEPPFARTNQSGLLIFLGSPLNRIGLDIKCTFLIRVNHYSVVEDDTNITMHVVLRKTFLLFY